MPDGDYSVAAWQLAVYSFTMWLHTLGRPNFGRMLTHVVYAQAVLPSYALTPSLRRE